MATPRLETVLAAAALTLGCERPSEPRAPVAEATPDGAVESVAAAPSAPSFVDLEVEGYAPAVVSVPSEGSGKPLLVAVHGAGDRPEWHCELWQHIVGNRGFVVCPRGRRYGLPRPGEDTLHYFPDHPWLRRALAAVTDAATARFGDRLDASRAVFAGYSQGAIMGALVIARLPQRYSRAAFIEGGHDEWNVPGAARFVAGGGRRILFACGIPHCERGAKRAVRHAKRGGLEARLLYARGAGHTYVGDVAELLAEAFDWLVEGDARWGTGRQNAPEKSARRSSCRCATECTASSRRENTGWTSSAGVPSPMRSGSMRTTAGGAGASSSTSGALAAPTQTIVGMISATPSAARVSDVSRVASRSTR